MAHLEIEVKYFLSDPATVRRRILSLGGVGNTRVFESNIRYEDAHESLKKQNTLLRLRKDKKVTLTYKSKPNHPTDTDVKIFKEVEVDVSDFSRMDQILCSIGFKPVQIYEKWRETFRLGDAVLCLDTLPIGDFLEIEADKSNIIHLTNTLGLQWEKRIRHTYLALFEMVRSAEHLDFNDLTFSNFASLSFVPSHWRKRFEARP